MSQKTDDDRKKYEMRMDNNGFFTSEEQSQVVKLSMKLARVAS